MQACSSKSVIFKWCVIKLIIVFTWFHNLHGRIRMLDDKTFSGEHWLCICFDIVLCLYNYCLVLDIPEIDKVVSLILIFILCQSLSIHQITGWALHNIVLFLVKFPSNFTLSHYAYYLSFQATSDKKGSESNYVRFHYFLSQVVFFRTAL